MAETTQILQSDESPAAQAEASEAIDFASMTPQQRVGELERSLRGEGPSEIEGFEEPAQDGEEAVAEINPATEQTPEQDEFDTKLAALQAKAEAERARVAAKKQSDVKAIDLRKKEEELASIAHMVLEEQKGARAALEEVKAYKNMSVQELIYEAMQRSGDANAVAEAFLAMNDPATIANIQAKKREAETVNPLQKRLDDLERRLAQKEQEAHQAQSQAQMYAEINAAASLSQQHSNEVPYVSKLAVKNPQLFKLRYDQARNILMQEHGQAPTGNVLLRMEEDLAPELNEIREVFGFGESPSSVQGSSSSQSGRVKPTIVTNRAASQRTQVAEEGEGLPDDVRDRARLLEQRLRG